MSSAGEPASAGLEQGESKDENSKLVEATKPAEIVPNPSHLIEQVINLFGSIRLTVEREVVPRRAFSALDFNSLSPGFDEISVINMLPPYLRLHFIGDDKVAFAELRGEELPIFNTFTEYLESSLSFYKSSLEKSKFLMLKPTTVDLNDVRCSDPNLLGFPLTEVLNGAVYDQQALIRSNIATIFDVKNVIRRRNLLYSIRALLPPAISAFHTSIFTSLFYTKGLYETLNRYLSRYTLKDGELPPYVPTTGEYQILKYLHLPTFLKEEICHLPESVAVSVNAVLSLLTPTVNFSPIAMSTVLKEAQVSTTSGSQIPSFSHVSYSDSMIPEITMYLASFLYPGAIQAHIEIDIPDVKVDFSSYAGLLGMFCKIMFFADYARYSTSGFSIASNIDPESVNLVESWIMSFVIKATKPKVNPTIAFDPSNFPLTNLGGNFPQELAGLRTTGNGSGWLNSGGNVYKEDVFHREFYSGYDTRLAFLSGDDDSYESYDTVARRQFVYANWRTCSSILKILSGRNYPKGIYDLFSMCAPRIADFMIRMNEYCRFDGESGLKMPRASLIKAMSDGNQKPVIYNIKTSTIVYLARSLNGEKPFKRNITPYRQILIESAIAKEAIEIKLNKNFIDASCDIFGLRGKFTSKKLWKLATSGAGLLSKHIHSALDQEIFGDLDQFGNTITSDYFLCANRAINSVTSNLMYHGVRNNVLIGGRMYYRTKEELSRLSDQASYIATIVQQTDVDTPVNLPTLALLREEHRILSELERYKASVDDRFLSINVPNRFVIQIEKTLPSGVYNIMINSRATEFKMVNDIGFPTSTIRVSDIRKSNLMFQDNLYSCNSVYCTEAMLSSDFAKIFMNLTEFVRNISSHTTLISTYDPNTIVFVEPKIENDDLR